MVDFCLNIKNNSGLIHRGITRKLGKLLAQRYHAASLSERNSIFNTIIKLIIKHDTCSISDDEYALRELLK